MPSRRKRTFERSGKLSELELARLISIAEAAELSGLSEDGWRRHHRDLFVAMSPGRVGVRLRDALFLGSPGKDDEVQALPENGESQASTTVPHDSDNGSQPLHPDAAATLASPWSGPT
jgi:hypothetical protein